MILFLYNHSAFNNLCLESVVILSFDVSVLEKSINCLMIYSLIVVTGKMFNSVVETKMRSKWFIDMLIIVNQQSMNCTSKINSSNTAGTNNTRPPWHVNKQMQISEQPFAADLRNSNPHIHLQEHVHRIAHKYSSSHSRHKLQAHTWFSGGWANQLLPNTSC